MGASSASAAILGADGSPTAGDPSLTSWLRSDAGVTLNGGTVAWWDDWAAGAGPNALLNMYQPTAGSQPGFVGSNPLLSGAPSVHFDGVNDLMRRTANGTAGGAALGVTLPVSGNNDRTIFAVVSNAQKRGGSNGVEHVLHIGTGGQTDQTYGILVENSGGLPTFSNHYWVGFDPSNSASGWNARSVTFQYDNDFFAGVGRAGADRFWVNGQPAGTIDIQATGTAATAPANTLKTGNLAGSAEYVLGSRASAWQEGFQGDIAEVIIYNQALSTAERQSVESYLANKYSLSSPGIGPSSFTYDASNIAGSASSLTYNGSHARPATDTVNNAPGTPIIRLNEALGSEAGTVFTNRPVTLTPDYSFSTQFTYKMSGGSGTDCCGDNAGADGMSFVMHQDARQDLAIGVGGGALATAGTVADGAVTYDLRIQPSIQIELDTYHTGTYDLPSNSGTNGNHIGLNVSSARYTVEQSAPGAIPQHMSTDPANQTRNVWVDYDGNTRAMNVFVSAGAVKPASPTFTQQIDLSAIFSSSHDVYLGFAGATGGAVETHDITQWSFSSTPSASAYVPISQTVLNIPGFTGFDPLFKFNTVAGGVAPSIVGDRLRLTDAVTSQGTTAILQDPLQLGKDFSFHTDFAFELSLPGGSGDIDGLGADGFTFLVATGPNGPNIVGGVGGGLGIDGISANFVAVEFDTWNTGSFDAVGNSGTHIGVDSSGNPNVANSFVGPTAAVPRFNDGGVKYAWIDYDGETDLMKVYLASTNVKPALPSLTTTIDVAAALGYANEDVYMGFSAGTGGAFNRTEIVSWNATVPEPTTYALGAIGLAFLGLKRRRSKSK
jgi:hypothetical protein